ncbi:MAG: RNA-binding domain-containing protein [Methylococcaceae bacterium]
MSESKIPVGNIEIGMKVEINPQSDRTRLLRVQGQVSEVLTKNQNHPHGVLVKLVTGEQGRVKGILEGSLRRSFKPAINAKSTKKSNSLKDVIAAGETHNIEFKSDVLWSSKYTKEDIENHRPQSKELRAYGKNTSKIIIAKTLAGFLNSDGGTLVIGVKEDKENKIEEVIGVELEYSSLRDASKDGYRRMIVDLIKDYLPSSLFNQLNNYFTIEFEAIDGLTVCGIVVAKSDKKVFLKLQGKDYFYIRTDASTREIMGEEIVDYCESRFK